MKKSIENWDIIIIGAGILGMASAYYLKKSNPEKKILVIDKNLSSGQGNTAKSNAAYRDVFDTDINIILSQSSILYYKSLQQNHEIDLGLKEIGYLWLLNQEQFNLRNQPTILTEENERISVLDFLKIHDVEYKIYTKDQLKEKLPLLNLKGAGIDPSTIDFDAKEIEYGLLGKQCGSLDPNLLVKMYENQFKSLGGSSMYSTEVTQILLKKKGGQLEKEFIQTVWKNSEVAGIKARNKETGEEVILETQKLVVATGAWANQLLNPLGIRSGTKPKKRQLYRICNVEKLVQNYNFDNNYKSLPFTILPVGGIFLKPIPGANCVDVGCSDDIGREYISGINDPDDPRLDNPQGEVDFYLYNILPVLEAYFPSIFLENNRIERPSAGLYAYSLDKYPVIDKNKKLGNLYLVTGASGSGIMKADAIGRITSSLINGKEIASLYGGIKIKITNFSLHNRDLPEETLVL